MNSSVFGFVNKRRESAGISRGENNSVNSALDQLSESFGVPLPKRLHGAIDETDAELPDTFSFVQNSTPQLVVKKPNFTRDANADAGAARATERARAARFGV